ncbi:unnamed protein product [Chironomus riparius]|uniref:Uncharacterized protein n=1 Tax=Chironomus riparius TaxID=315576 RepID=A0A9N9S7L9_9DIPT|nr:unnamed protein product [Chironomus riparius]
MSIHRIYDYVNKMRCDEVVISLRDEFEFRVLKARQSVMIANNVVELVFKDWVFGVASRTEPVTSKGNAEIGASPSSLKLSGLTQVSRITTFYLIKLATAFEFWESKGVTGIKLIYDVERDAIRPFGFIAFAYVNFMKRFHAQKVNIYDEKINCEESLRVPVLLHEADKSLLDPMPVTLNKEICDANCLNATPLARVGSNSSLIVAIQAMDLDEPTVSNEPVESIEALLDETRDTDNDSVLSIDLSYDFDENMNLIKKTV